ncbi:MAG: type II secretion system protein GspD, partial [Planctomycetota bacterium]|jgi:type II secretory pathway component GspD/PulD (secretin)
MGMGGGGMGGGGMGGGGMMMGNPMARMRAFQLIFTIQQTVEPDTWYNEGGEGRINQYGESKLLIWQTPDIHKQVEDLLDELRKDIGEQVAIEARFLLVAENFLEDIGFDMDLKAIDIGGDFEPFNIFQDSISHVIPQTTGIPSSLGGSFTNPAMYTEDPITLTLDSLEVEFMIRATMAHSNSRALSAPKAIVLNGESATMDVTTTKRIKTNSEANTETVTTQGVASTITTWTAENEDIDTGVTLTITPVISKDKKYVILRVITDLEDLIDTTTETTQAIAGGVIVEDTYQNPTTQIASIMTRVNVPDKGTVMLGGLTLTAEKERESGTPFFSKLPILGRLFSNRSEVKDKSMLLILVKPTILLQDEQEADAIAAMAQ